MTRFEKRLLKEYTLNKEFKGWKKGSKILFYKENDYGCDCTIIGIHTSTGQKDFTFGN